MAAGIAAFAAEPLGGLVERLLIGGSEHSRLNTSGLVLLVDLQKPVHVRADDQRNTASGRPAAKIDG